MIVLHDACPLDTKGRPELAHTLPSANIPAWFRSFGSRQLSTGFRAIIVIGSIYCYRGTKGITVALTHKASTVRKISVYNYGNILPS